MSPQGFACDTTFLHFTICSADFQRDRDTLVKSDDGLDSSLVANTFDGFPPLFQLEGLVNDALGFDLTALKVVDRWGELVGLGEG